MLSSSATYYFQRLISWTIAKTKKYTIIQKVEIVMSSLEFTATNKILLLFSSIE